MDKEIAPIIQQHRKNEQIPSRCKLPNVTQEEIENLNNLSPMK